ncbi:family 1 glycosylhydrolase [Enterococcus moraviensis]|uniref:family 1 glycosylhydrolase n=1 Tax=Enterococcus moraviensis TaxID=155617 RepID=UPI001114FCD2|nr:family 1 glycosylhydrolase [Enterococcus moraviensis]
MNLPNNSQIPLKKNFMRSILLVIVQDGIEIFCFCPWSFIDLVSTTSGFRKRYGFVYVDRTDTVCLENRHRKDSFYWSQGVIRSNGKVL